MDEELHAPKKHHDDGFVQGVLLHVQRISERLQKPLTRKDTQIWIDSEGKTVSLGSPFEDGPLWPTKEEPPLQFDEADFEPSSKEFETPLPRVTASFEALAIRRST